MSCVWKKLVVLKLHLKYVFLDTVGAVPFDAKIVEADLKYNVTDPSGVIDFWDIFGGLFSCIAVFADHV